MSRNNRDRLIRSFNARRELCEMCSHEMAQKHITYPLDLMLGLKCFMQYQKDLPAGVELEVTTIDLNTTNSKEKLI